MISDETRFQLIRLLEANPQLSQRDLAKELDISLGKANYCLKALVHKGFVKVSNFRTSKNRIAYAYILTPRGIEEKANLTVRYLKIKLREYEDLQSEIKHLKNEAAKRISE